PRLRLVPGDVEPAVVADEQMVVVMRVNPERVMVTVRETLHLLPVLAAIGSLEERAAALVRDVRVGGVHADLAVVHRAIHAVRQEPPCLAGIVRPPDARLVGAGCGELPRRVPALRLPAVRLRFAAAETSA